MNLRNKPVDKRRLNAQDRESYRPQARESAIARTKQWRGQLAWNANSPPRTQVHTPGSGGFTMGRQAQAARLREVGAQRDRSKALQPDTSIYVNKIYE